MSHLTMEGTDSMAIQKEEISKEIQRRPKAKLRRAVISKRRRRTQMNLTIPHIPRKIPRNFNLIQVVGTERNVSSHRPRLLYKRPFLHHRQPSPFSFWRWIIGRYRSLRKFLTGGRPWTLDRLYGLFSVIAIGTTTWIIVGTTSAVSALVVLANTLSFQRYLVDWIGRLATEQTGVEMRFEKADVGSWFDASIRLQNVSFHREGSKDISAINIVVEEAKVRLSFRRYLEGSGILQELSIKGASGFIDSSRVEWDYSVPSQKMTWTYGDFDFERLQVEDLKIDFRVPYYEQPLLLSIFNMESDRFRKQWFLYDILSAKCIRGSFQNCLFNFQKVESSDSDKNHLTSVLQMDGLPIDVVTGGSTGPLSWLTSGFVDLKMVATFPLEHKMKSSVISPEITNDEEIPVTMDVTLKHLTAKVPVSSPDLSYMSSALIRPVVAYLNTNYTEIPLKCAFKMKLRDFDGAWYPYDARVWEYLSDSSGREIAKKVEEQKQPRRVRELVLIGLDGVVRGLAYLAYCAFEMYI